MSRRALWLVLFLLCMARLAAFAGDSKPNPKLKALLVTGGGYHDYKSLVPLLTDKISEFANVEWEIQWGPEVLADPNFGQSVRCGRLRHVL